MTRDEIDRRIKAGGGADELWECLYLTHLEIAELLDHVQKREISPWIYPAFVLTAHTGACRSEMMRAKPEDVDLTGETLTIREKKRVKGRRTTRRLPLSARLTEVLTSWMGERSGASFLFGPGTKMVTPQGAITG